jgi:hypothetical protein
MRRGHWLLLGSFASALAMLAACVGDDPAAVQSGIDAGSADASTSGDAGNVAPGTDGGTAEGGQDAGDAGASPCDPTRPFVSVGAISEINGAGAFGQSYQARLTPDELTVYWISQPDNQSPSILSGTRVSPSGAFGNLVPLNYTFGQSNSPASPNAVANDPTAMILEMHFTGNPPSSAIYKGVYAGGQWGLPTTGADVERFPLGRTCQDPYVTADGLDLVFSGSDLDGGTAGFTIYEMTRNAVTDDFTETTRRQLFELSAAGPRLRSPVLSNDRLTIYFADDVSTDSSFSDYDIWYARRTSPTASFGQPQPVQGVNESSVDDHPSWISTDQCRLFFYSKRSAGNLANYRAGRSP